MSAFRLLNRWPLAALGALVILVFAASAPARAAEVKAGDLVILDVWARATPVATSAVYVTIRNDGAAADRLTGASTDLAKMVHLHETIEENGVMKMRPIDGIDIPPHATVPLKPGDLHIMLMGLSQPLKEGTTFPIVLKFEKAGAVTVTVTVKGAGGSDDMKGMGDMKMDSGSGK